MLSHSPSQRPTTKDILHVLDSIMPQRCNPPHNTVFLPSVLLSRLTLCVCFHNEVVFCPHLKVLFINPYVAIGSIYPVPNSVYLPPDLSLFWCCLTIGTSGRSFVTFLVCDLATKWHRGTVSSDPLKTTATSRSDSRGDRRWSQRHLRNYRGMQPVSRRLTTLASTLSQTRSSQRWNPSFLQRATVAATV